MKIASDTLQTRHLFLLGRAPGETAQALYRRFPNQRGFSLEGEQDSERFEATAVLALTQAFEDAQVRVLFFVPKALKPWAFEQFNGIARPLFRKLKEKKDASKEALLSTNSLFKRVFSQIMIGSEPTLKAPPHWVAYGFSEHDPRCPAWLRDGLV